MPPPRLVDLSKVDRDALFYTREQIYDILPHRFEFALLDGVCHWDKEAGELVAFRDVREDDWWVRGHIPGQPLLPGVLMLEMAAHVATLMAKLCATYDSFIGFAGVDDCKFRDSVVPPARLFLLAAKPEVKPRRIRCLTQGVANDKLIFEARITGITMR